MAGGDRWRGVAAVTAGLATLAAATLWLRRRYVVVDIVGVSMEPTYRAGSRVLVRRTPATKVLRGQVVVFEPNYGDADPAADPGVPARRRRAAARRPPRRGDPGRDRSWMLKRSVAVPGDPIPRDRVPALDDAPGAVVPPGHLVVMGDNPAASLDSRHFGYVTPERVLGVVVRSMR